MTFAQVAKHLGWDEGSLTRYLKGTWRVSAGRQAMFEVFLDASPDALSTQNSGGGSNV